VVDSFAESRQKDLLHLAEELELENEQDKKRLAPQLHPTWIA